MQRAPVSSSHCRTDVSAVVEAGLCTGCGTCAGVCPSSAVVMFVSNALLLPKIREDLCTSCGICLECCPGHAIDLVKLNQEVFGRQPQDLMMGNFLQCYIGHSLKGELHRRCSSGGIAIEFLILALEKGIVDGAVITKMKENSPLESEAFVARTAEDVILGAQAKYCPAAPNVALKRILSEEGRFAFVGLPCQIHGIRKAEDVYDALKRKIILHVGLFCGHTVNFEGTELLLRKLHVNRSDVARIEYRGLGRPSTMIVRLRNGRVLKIRFNRNWEAYWNIFSPFFFTPIRCLMCPDQFNELADVSFGDAWLPEFERSRYNESILVSRTPNAERVLAAMMKEKRVSLTPVMSDKVKQSQAFSLNFKKRELAGRLSFLKSLGRGIPDLNPVLADVSRTAKLDAFCCYLSFTVSSNRRLKSFLTYVPLPLFRIYFGIFKSLSFLSR